MIPRSATASVALACFALCASRIDAQTRQHDVEFSSGLAATSSALSNTGPLGAVVRLGIAQRNSRAYQFRLDAEASFASADISADSKAALRSLGITYGVTVGPASRAIAPYGLAGVGVTWINGYEGVGWAGIGPTSRLGIGLRFPFKQKELRAEVAVVSAFWSTSSTWSPRALYWPLTIGLAF